MAKPHYVVGKKGEGEERVSKYLSTWEVKKGQWDGDLLTYPVYAIVDVSVSKKIDSIDFHLQIPRIQVDDPVCSKEKRGEARYG